MLSKKLLKLEKKWNENEIYNPKIIEITERRYIRKIDKKKKGQIEFGPAILIAIILGLILFAPIMLRIIGTVTGTFFTQMNSTSSSAVNEASDAVDKVYNFFDYLIVIAMFVNIIILFISSWYIDTNPVFIVLYIMFAFIFFLLLPNMLDAVDTVWNKMDSSTLSAQDTWETTSLNLTYTDFIRRNIMMFSLIIIAVSGVIMYAKFKLTQGAFT